MVRKKLSAQTYKYRRGVVAVCAGSEKFPGAATLTVGGARLGNAGFVKFLSKSSDLQRLVVERFPDVVPISSLKNERVNSLVLGPGGSTLNRVPRDIPLVLDSAAISLLKRESVRGRAGITVITPHEGELRFLDIAAPDSEKNRSEIALKVAKQFAVITVLKGHHTVIASPSGEVHIDKVGGPELATAGSGDILAGLIGSMLAGLEDNRDAFNYVKSAVELHSLAGRMASKKYRAVTTLEILECLALVP
jgi:hydroxyethylthiazole kinase-like uncharacterized protein yjeF